MIRVKSAKGLLDVSLIMLALLTVWRVVIPHPLIARDYSAFKLGDVLDVPGVRWNDASRHVVLMISTACPWCSKSADWYRDLSSELSKQKDIHLVVLHTEEPAAVKQWLQSRRITPTEVARISNASEIGLSVTPTALIVDHGGKVTDGVLGMLKPADELAFRARYLSVNGAKPISNIPNEVERSAFLAMLAQRTDLQVIDIRDRSEASSRRVPSLAMPLDEIDVRAPIELAASRAVAVDCSPGWMERCRLAARLIRAHVADVFVARP